MENKELINIAHDISALLNKELESRPYGANIIDELHAGENAHSRILRLLLQYSGGRKYPIYVRFLTLIEKHCSIIPRDFKCVDPYFANEEDRIDLLITDGTDDNKFAVIIENKVCGAGDQDKQIERYIEQTKNKVPLEQIIVVYLTLDGNKEVTDKSLKKKKKKYLRVNDDSRGRYVPLNYRDHIIPWIEEIIPEMQVKEDLLISALRQYLDYLKGICHLRESDEPIYDKIQRIMQDKLGLKSLEETLKVRNEVSDLDRLLEELMIEQMRDLMELKLLSPLRELFNKIELFQGATITDINACLPDWGFRIIVPSWKKTLIQTDLEKEGQIYGIIHKDVNDQVAQNVRDKLRENLGNEELHPIGKSSLWWPWYQVLQKSGINYVSKDQIYREIENGKIFNYFESWLREVEQATKGLDM